MMKRRSSAPSTANSPSSARSATVGSLPGGLGDPVLELLEGHDLRPVPSPVRCRCSGRLRAAVYSPVSISPPEG